ncbi:GNAT family N-acetyltransferase [Mangrovimonas aestuarii]|uniref:GNAT family N-acetyltransferase n=1 Tax=Mangrovimonas aestuarii TaxID=3018443 RepID=UPI0023785B53|nr:GNAT family N-acetyltransferase [Mangrovimonas aestuarii]
MTNKIILRRATLNDMNELHELFVDTIKQTCKSDYGSEQIRVWTASVKNTSRWTQAISEQYFIVAEINGVIAGFGSLKDGNYIDFMYVHKDYQGKGVANCIYSDLESESKRFKTKTLTSDVSKTAQPFFEKKGFEVVLENINIRDGVEINNYLMRKYITF